MKKRGSSFLPVPSRRHNKTGVVERKNREVKDSFEQLENDTLHSKFSAWNKMSLAQFTSNILYGGKLLSAFEMVRGYTPSIEGSAQKQVPKEIWAAFQEMEARRLLARMLKSKSTKSLGSDIHVGEMVLCLIPGGKRPRGKWIEETVVEVPDEHSVVVGTGRKKKIIALEDVRKMP